MWSQVDRTKKKTMGIFLDRWRVILRLRRRREEEGVMKRQMSPGACAEVLYDGWCWNRECGMLLYRPQPIISHRCIIAARCNPGRRYLALRFLMPCNHVFLTAADTIGGLSPTSPSPLLTRKQPTSPWDSFFWIPPQLPKTPCRVSS